MKRAANEQMINFFDSFLEQPKICPECRAKMVKLTKAYVCPECVHVIPDNKDQ